MGHGQVGLVDISGPPLLLRTIQDFVFSCRLTAYLTARLQDVKGRHATIGAKEGASYELDI
jgi:hypothetical protein